MKFLNEMVSGHGKYVCGRKWKRREFELLQSSVGIGGMENGSWAKSSLKADIVERKKYRIGCSASAIICEWLHGLFIGEGKRTLINSAKLQLNRINHPSWTDLGESADIWLPFRMNV